MKTEGYTDKENEALEAFESACSDYDLYAFGANRRLGACKVLLARYETLVALKLTDAMTAKERSEVARARAYVA